MTDSEKTRLDEIREGHSNGRCGVEDCVFQFLLSLLDASEQRAREVEAKTWEEAANYYDSGWEGDPGDYYRKKAAALKTGRTE